MKISEVIAKIKSYSRGFDRDGNPIDPKTTRDQVLYGDTEKGCTGIVTTCFASVDVIRKTHELGANLIISHEALFWNHGDHQDWLQNEKNSVYLRKKALLDEYGITVWRDHDYIHSGIPDGNGGWYDGIFRGFLHYAGLEQYYVSKAKNPVQFGGMPIELYVPDGIQVKELARKIISGINLNGIRLIGDPETVIRRIAIPMHCIGFADKETISYINAHQVDCLITMELIDYTVNEYMRDGMMLGDSKAILAVGHFNVEEFGMKYMLKWLPEALGHEEMKADFIQSGDMNHFIV